MMILILMKVEKVYKKDFSLSETNKIMIILDKMMTENSKTMFTSKLREDNYSDITIMTNLWKEKPYFPAQFSN